MQWHMYMHRSQADSENIELLWKAFENDQMKLDILIIASLFYFATGKYKFIC